MTLFYGLIGVLSLETKASFNTDLHSLQGDLLDKVARNLVESALPDLFYGWGGGGAGTYVGSPLWLLNCCNLGGRNPL
jgi:hypothetical protein